VAMLIAAGASIHFRDPHGYDAMLHALHHREMTRYGDEEEQAENEDVFVLDVAARMWRRSSVAAPRSK
jgi:hypothetical protein